mgnify:CR=1 FL=1
MLTFVTSIIDIHLKNIKMAVLVGKKAPDFTASAVINGEEIVENFKLSDYAGKYVILFFYPKCSTPDLA